jgi:hypothetical protein
MLRGFIICVLTSGNLRSDFFNIIKIREEKSFLKFSVVCSHTVWITFSMTEFISAAKVSTTVSKWCLAFEHFVQLMIDDVRKSDQQQKKKYSLKTAATAICYTLAISYDSRSP